VVAVLFSLVGAFYYLRVIKLMYFDEPADSGKITAGVDVRLVLSFNGIAALALGLWPGHLMDAGMSAIGTTLSTFLFKVLAG
jgi:NADH-quinone oxidoreductase subunit N